MRIATGLASTLASWLARASAIWGALSPRNRWIAGGGAGVVVLGFALAVTLLASGRPCGARSDVEARVADLSAMLQADAAEGTISIEILATRIKLLNAAATAFETSKDLGAYCSRLDELNKEFGGQAR